MSSAVVSTSAALSRLFVFDEETELEACSSVNVCGFQSTIKNQQSAISFSIGDRKSAIENSVILASRLEIRPAPAMAASGIPAIDALTGGLPRGCLTEICGPASSGRTTVLLAALAAATHRGEFCVAVDAGDTLDPHSVADAGVDLDRLLWVRCGESLPRRHRGPEKDKANSAIRERRAGDNQAEHRIEQALRATDLLLESGGFGLIVLDLGDIPPQAARRIPLTTWFRFRRAVEHKPTILLAIEQQAIAGSCSSLVLQFGPMGNGLLEEAPERTHLLTRLNISAELVRSRLERKPARSTAAFSSRTAWAG